MKKSFCLLLCVAVVAAVYIFCVIGEIKKLIFPAELYKVEFHLNQDAPVFYLAKETNDKIDICRYVSSSYLCSANEKIEYLYLSLPPIPINIEKSVIYRAADNGEIKQLNSDEARELFFVISKDPKAWTITAEETDNTLGVKSYKLNGDLSGNIITYATHGDDRMRIPAEWTDINEASKPKLFNLTALLIAIGAGLALGIFEFAVMRKKK